MPKAANRRKKLVQETEPAAFARRSYELTVVVSPVVKAEKRADVVASINKLITGVAGEVLKVDEWGLRELAYPIQDQRSGWYVFLTIQLPTNEVSHLDQTLIRDKNVLRHLVVSL